MRLIPRVRHATLATLGVVAICLLHAPTQARASTGQYEIFQDDPHMLANPAQTLQQIRDLGANVVRVSLQWNLVAPTPRPPGFDPTDPASYPSANWAPYDTIVTDARQDGITVDFSLTGPAPPWAAGGGQPSPGGLGQWKPSAAAFKQFAQAVGTRYSGTYDPTLDETMSGDPNDLPRVSFWEIWNEPNFGGDLAPQAIKGSSVPTAAPMYRSLLNAGWSGLQGDRARPRHDPDRQPRRPRTEAPAAAVFPRGSPATSAATKPLQFIRTLYCVSATYKELRGGAAGLVGCPTSAAGSRGFRAANRALFNASGFATHPYPVNLPPTVASSTDPDYTEFSELPRLASMLDRIQRVYGSGTRFPIYNNEYGYITNPPNHELTALNPTSKFVSPTTAAYYINWAEYLSWRNPRIASTMQYLLYDPNPRLAPEFGGFASGLIFYGGLRKPGLRRVPDASVPPDHHREVTRPKPRGLGMRATGPLRATRHRRSATGADPIPTGFPGGVHDVADRHDHELAGLFRRAHVVPGQRVGQAGVDLSEQGPAARRPACNSIRARATPCTAAPNE